MNRIFWGVMVPILLLLAGSGRTDGQSSSIQNRETADSLAFAKFLYQNSEFSEAALEARRVQFYSTDEAIKWKARTFIAFARYRNGDFRACLRETESLLPDIPDNRRLSLLHGIALVRSGEESGYQLVRAVAEDEFDPGIVSDRARYELIWAALERGLWSSARYWLDRIEDNSSLATDAEQMKRELEEAERLPRRSPAVSACLAAVAPGAGHLYCKRPGDAVIAFLVNGLFIWGAAECFGHDQNAAGIILGSLELTWYAGNIVSAMNVANRFNRANVTSFVDGMRENHVTIDDLDRSAFEKAFLDD